MKKFSIYNFLFNNKGNHYIYNLLTTAIISLDEETYSKISKNDIQLLSFEEILTLQEQGFVVDADADEPKKYQYYYDKTRYDTTSKILALCFIPTYGCNLACPYCYEGKNKSFKKIEQEDIDSILSFYKKKLQEGQKSSPITQVEILLYGGEPLMDLPSLEYFCQGIEEISKQYSIEVYFSMVSNLTLLNQKSIDLIRKYKILTQVSIDGTKEEHDTRRIYSNGLGTYNLIQENLAKLVNAGLKEYITLRLNIDSQNIESVAEIFENAKQYSNDIYFGILSSYKNANEDFQNTCVNTNCPESLLLNTHELYRKINLPTPQKFGKKGPCALNSENKYIIDCYLNVYKCDLLVNHPECSVGKISKEGEFICNENFFKQMSFSPCTIDKCTVCKFLPLCGGGCPATTYLNSGQTNADISCPSCEFNHEKLKQVLIDFVEDT